MENKEKLIYEIDKLIDNTEDTKEFEFDKDITIAVEEYKTRENSGYITTFQTIRVKDYFIKCNHLKGQELVLNAERIRESIDKIGIDKTIEELTKPQDDYDTKIREWK